MPNNNNILQKFVRIVHDVLEPFVQMIGGTDDDKKEALTSLGLEPNSATNSMSISHSTLDSVNQYIEKSADQVDEQAFFAVLEDLIQISAAIKEFFEAASAGNPNLTASEITTAYMNLMVLNYFRLRSPVFFKIVSILDALDQQSVRSGGILNFFENIGLFFKNAGEGFKLETEDHARNLSDTVLLVGGVGLTLLNKLFNDFDIPITINAAYGYDSYPSSSSPHADQLSQRALSFSAKLASGEAVETTLTNTLILVPHSHQGKAAVMDITGELKLVADLGNHWKFTFDTGGLGLVFRIGEGADVSLATNPFVELTLENDTDTVNKGSLLADPVIKLGYGRIKTSIKFNKDDIEFKLKPTLAFELGRGTHSSFPFTIIPEKGLDQKFEIGFGISQKKGFFLEGGGNGVTIAIPVYATLGPVSFDVITLAYQSDEVTKKKEIEVSISFKLALGSVIVATVSRTGALLNLTKNSTGGGVLGYDIDFGFKFPNGIGISVDASVVKGGGYLYFDSKAGEYFGALELSFKNMFSFKAIGIINTKMPDGSDGFSLLIIITGSGFSFQLGFGFTLNGIGGLLGLNRTIKIDVLVDGLKTNTLKSILFPEDVVANINRIISDLKQVFPIQQDHFVLGPMAKIGWGTPTLVTIDLGVLIDFPDPRIVILGVLKASLPTIDNPVVKLQINFIGIIDIPHGFIFFRADLYDSKILVFTLTGSLALLISWGEVSAFALSVGGFHPDFHDIPSIPQLPNGFKNMDRLAISLLSGNNPRITIQCYLAITSNTVQFGAKAELYAEAAGFNIYGFIGFDVLFQFEPFHFIAQLSAGLALRHNTSVIMGISLSGTLSGPKPWDVVGEASFSILFFDVSVGFHVTWGDPEDAIATIVQDLQAIINSEMVNNQNWQAVIPDNNTLHVSVKDLKLIQPEDNPSPNIVIHPVGMLTFSERTLPLNVTIEKFGTKVPKDVNRFQITSVTSGETTLSTQPVKEKFAPANFFNLTDSEKLSRHSFEDGVSGFNITASADLQIAPAVNKSVDYELTYLRKKRFMLIFAGIYKYAKSLFETNLKGNAVAQSSLSYSKNRMSLNAPQKVVIKPDQFVIAQVSDMKLHSEDLVSGSYSTVVGQYNSLIRKQPALKNKIQIVSEYELNMN